MDKENVLKFIKAILGSFKFHPVLIQELMDSLAESGVETKFFNLFIARLKQLSTLGIFAIKLEEFENIGGGLFSMHLAGKGFNIRILYAFLPNREPVLLLAFYERSGKKNTDYSSYIAPALERLKSIKEGYCNV